MRETAKIGPEGPELNNGILLKGGEGQKIAAGITQGEEAASGASRSASLLPSTHPRWGEVRLPLSLPLEREDKEKIVKKQRKKEILWSVVLAGILLVASIPAISAPLKGKALYFPIGEGQLVLVNTTTEPIGLAAQALDAEGNPLGGVDVPETFDPAANFTLSLQEGFPEEAVTLEVQPDQRGVIGFLVDANGISHLIQGKAAKQTRGTYLFKTLQTVKTTQLQRWDQILDYSRKDFFDKGYHPGECKQFIKIIVCEAGGNKGMVRSSGDYAYNQIRRGMILQSSMPHTAIALTNYDPNLGVWVRDSNWEGGLGKHMVGGHYLTAKQLKNSGFKGYWAKPGDFGLTDRILQIADSLRFANAFTVNR